MCWRPSIPARRRSGAGGSTVRKTPIAARSLREFWGERWNRVVGSWLRRTFFVPWARRRHIGVGLALAFTVSALLHGYMALAAVGLAAALPMTTFFLLQGAL